MASARRTKLIKSYQMKCVRLWREFRVLMHASEIARICRRLECFYVLWGAWFCRYLIIATIFTCAACAFYENLSTFTYHLPHLENKLGWVHQKYKPVKVDMPNNFKISSVCGQVIIWSIQRNILSATLRKSIGFADALQWRHQSDLSVWSKNSRFRWGIKNTEIKMRSISASSFIICFEFWIFVQIFTKSRPFVKKMFHYEKNFSIRNSFHENFNFLFQWAPVKRVSRIVSFEFRRQRKESLTK